MAIQLPVEPSSFLLLGACMFVAGFTSGSITFGVCKSTSMQVLWSTIDHQAKCKLSHPLYPPLLLSAVLLHHSHHVPPLVDDFNHCLWSRGGCIQRHSRSALLSGVWWNPPARSYFILVACCVATTALTSPVHVACPLCVQHLFVFVPLAIFTRRKGSLVLFFSMFPANTCGMFIGVALLLVLPPKPVKLVLAIAVLITALWRWGVNFTIYIKQRRKRRNQTEAVNDASGAAGVSSGGGGVKASGGAEEQRGVEMSLAPSHTAASTSSTDSDHSDNDCQHTNATAMTAVPCEAPTAETGSSVPPKAAAAAGAAGSGAAAPTCKERVVAEFLRNRPSCVVGVGGAIAGFIAGILGGLIAAGGPPLMIFVTVAQLDKALSTWRAHTHTMCVAVGKL